MVMALEGPMGAVQAFQAGEAQTQLNQVQAQAAQFKMAQEQQKQAQTMRMQQLAQGIQYGQDIGENQRTLANALAQNGFIGEASELWKGAEQTAEKVARAESAQALELTRQAQSRERLMGAWERAIPFIMDQASLSAVNMQLAEKGVVSPFGNVYDPARMERVRNQIAIQKGHDTEEVRRLRIEAAEAKSESARQSREFRDMLAEREYERRLEKDKTDAKYKGSERAGGAPTKAEMEEATAFLDSQNIIQESSMSEVDKANAARKLQDVATRLFKTNPGIHSREEAMEVAFAQEILPKLVKQDGFWSRYGMGKPGLKYKMPGQKIDAPQSAIDYLKTHPELKDAFKGKYGYLPEGM